MTSESAIACAEMLLEYQGIVVHDLRGDLNGLLLTVDFMRRQLSAHPDILTLFGDTLGDLDHVRQSLNRTLNQLDMVGHARRTLGNRQPAEVARQNLSDVVTDVIRQHLAERGRRRKVTIAPPPPSDVAVRADPVLLHLAVQRMLHGWVETGRDTELQLVIERVTTGDGPHARIRIRFAHPQQATSDAMASLDDETKVPVKGSPVAAIRLSRAIAGRMGGTLQFGTKDQELCLELPATVEMPGASCGEER